MNPLVKALNKAFGIRVKAAPTCDVYVTAKQLTEADFHRVIADPDSAIHWLSLRSPSNGQNDGRVYVWVVDADEAEHEIVYDIAARTFTDAQAQRDKFTIVLEHHLARLPKRPTAAHSVEEKARVSRMLDAARAGKATGKVKKEILKYIDQIELGADRSQRALTRSARYRQQCGL